MSLTNFLNKLRLIKQVLLSKPPVEDKTAIFNCSVCGAVNVKMHPLPIYYFEHWQKNQTVHNPFFIETMNIANYMCPKCYASDRDRLYALYFKQYTAEKKGTIQFLDIAPANGLKTFIKALPNIKYRTMDLMMPGVDDHLDITNMHTYHDEQFDFFLCSHVLEHIQDDKKAISELHRILKKGGKGITMVPVNLQLQETIEDINCIDIALRWKNFFQDDHVRMYAKNDFLNRLTSGGFTVEQLDINYFGKEAFEKYAIYPTSVLYVVSN
jgi:SAM-dependent methyltransferase